MNNNVARWFIRISLSISMVLIVATTVWAAYQPVNMCPGNTDLVIISSVCAFLIVIFVCAFLCGGCTRLGFFVIGTVLLVLIIDVGLVALTTKSTETEGWGDIKYCLYRGCKVCSQLQRKYSDDVFDEFNGRQLTRLESGCCKPPKECNFKYVNPTVWLKPANDTYLNIDCYKWDNDPKKLCYNCEVCKLSFGKDVKKVWNISGALFGIAWLMLVSVSVVAKFFYIECHYENGMQVLR